MTKYQGGNKFQYKDHISANDQKHDQTNNEANMNEKLVPSPGWTTKDNTRILLEIYEPESHAGEPKRDIKGGASSLHLESESGSLPASVIPHYSSDCKNLCCGSPCPTSDPRYPCPPRQAGFCLSGLHQEHRDNYPNSTESRIPSGYPDSVEHDDLYLPTSHPLNAVSHNYSGPTTSRPWSPPSPRQKCHCRAAQHHVSPRAAWDMQDPEFKICFQSFHASPQESITRPDESHFSLEMPLQASTIKLESKSTSPMQSYHNGGLSQKHLGIRDWIGISCQCSPRIDPDSGPKSYQTRKSGTSSPISADDLEPSPCSSPCSPKTRLSPRRPSSASPDYPLKSMEHAPHRLLSRLPYTAELAQLTVEKSFQRSCCSREDNANHDESNGERAGKLKLYDSGTGALISRASHPDSSSEILLPGTGSLECTCQKKPAKTSHNQFCYPTQKGSLSPSPSGYSPATKQWRNTDSDPSHGAFLNDVKRILSSGVPKCLVDDKKDWRNVWKKPDRNEDCKSLDRQQDLKQDSIHDFHAKVRSVLHSDSPITNFIPSERTTNLMQELSSSGKTCQQHELLSSTDIFSSAKSTLKPALPSIVSCGRLTDSSWKEYPRIANAAPCEASDWRQEHPPPQINFALCERTTDQRQAQREYLSTRSSMGSLRKLPSSGSPADWKQASKSPSNLDWKFPSRETDYKQEYFSCLKTTERGTSPIVSTPTKFEPSPGLSRSRDRPKTAPIFTNFKHGEGACTSRKFQRGNDRLDTTKRTSARKAPEAYISPPEESDEDCRHHVQITDPPEALKLSKRPSKGNSNKLDKSSCLRNDIPKQGVVCQCCCGRCKTTNSRGQVTTKCPFCANVHSCCCGMCSCPFPTCVSKSPLADSISSKCTSTTDSIGNDKLPSDNYNRSFASRHKSLSPMRGKHPAGLEKPDKFGPRSKSSLSKHTFQRASPRSAFQSFHDYLKEESRRSKSTLNSYRRRSERQSRNWRPPSNSPDRNCSRRTNQLSTNKAPGELRAPNGTHPILMSSRESNIQAVEHRLPYSRSHHGCGCPQCTHGKL
ncbi:uncharacterized protein [Physcomitrium patens]|uniref:Uncharacterized protein n=1 Tax=Physcomitrium patens TaxID=3218 RepID=A0A2K1JJ47_PHYPA|nr:hypothetical protein PHYPA_018978 [Physcomitrium patens]